MIQSNSQAVDHYFAGQKFPAFVEFKGSLLDNKCLEKITRRIFYVMCHSENHDWLEKSHRKRPLERPGYRWEGNIKTYLRET
jgi:hypothetical protein